MPTRQVQISSPAKFGPHRLMIAHVHLRSPRTMFRKTCYSLILCCFPQMVLAQIVPPPSPRDETIAPPESHLPNGAPVVPPPPAPSPAIPDNGITTVPDHAPAGPATVFDSVPATMPPSSAPYPSVPFAPTSPSTEYLPPSGPGYPANPPLPVVAPIVPGASAGGVMVPYDPYAIPVPAAILPPVGGLHNRYPYYSYRRPWFTPGPASRNVTIIW